MQPNRRSWVIAYLVLVAASSNALANDRWEFLVGGGMGVSPPRFGSRSAPWPLVQAGASYVVSRSLAIDLVGTYRFMPRGLASCATSEGTPCPDFLVRRIASLSTGVTIVFPVGSEYRPCLSVAGGAYSLRSRFVPDVIEPVTSLRPGFSIGVGMKAPRGRVALRPDVRIHLVHAENDAGLVWLRPDWAAMYEVSAGIQFP